MNFNQIRLGGAHRFLVAAAGDEALPAMCAPGQEVEFIRDSGSPQLLMRLGGQLLAVAPLSKDAENALAAACATNLPRLAWVVESTVHAGRPCLILDLLTFPRVLQLDACFGVGDRTLESLRKVAGAKELPPLLRYLEQDCLLPGPTGSGALRAIATAGEGGDSAKAFQLHGRTLRVSVKSARQVDGTPYLRVEKLTHAAGPTKGHPFLIEGKLTFADATKTGQLLAATVAQLASLGDRVFIERWHEFQRIEQEAKLRRARDFGAVAYQKAEPLRSGQWRFSLGQDEDLSGFELLKDSEQLEACAERPAFLDDEALKWEETGGPSGGPRPFAGTCRDDPNSRARSVDLDTGDLEGAPPGEGFLVLSRSGDVVAMQRRSEAHDLIKTLKCPLPQIALILEESQQLPRATPTNLAGLTNAVRKKVFPSRPPTPRQEEAIILAINTPDIALIQGPPGTGKTTTLVAILERLKEVVAAERGLHGRFLVTGFQHDAVDNAIARTSINGLPAFRFGGKKGRTDSLAIQDRALENWIQGNLEYLRREHRTAAVGTLEVAVQEAISSYCLAPGSDAQAASLLENLRSRLDGRIPYALLDELRELARDLVASAQDGGDTVTEARRLVRVARAVRTTAGSFADDGPLTAGRALRTLDAADRLEEPERLLLKQAATWFSIGIPPFLEQLAVARRNILLRLLPSPRLAGQTGARAEVIDVMGRCRDALEEKRNRSADGVQEVIDSYQRALESDPRGVKDSLQAYSTVFAATCQQSAGGELRRVKDNKLEYDTVIVDEAARANPLDLFIPMVQAKHRVILVGDQRQLPHVIDSELERELEAAAGDDVSAKARNEELLKQSLFGRLFKYLQERETSDGVRRTITLDEQYRMHPALGDFVSQQFYAPFGEGFRSPRPASEFAHSLPGFQGRPAAWIDVPAAAGSEDKSKSKGRRSEANRLAAELKRQLDHSSSEGLSFGVITFYKKQKDLIFDELLKLGMATRGAAGPELEEHYRDLVLPNGRKAERLRIGTVDSFQGMEFDVVFLSMVRCNDYRDQTESDRRRRYGHLMSPNRLCVAMSRQKRLLVVVGDAGMLSSAGAAEAIGPLVRFHHDLCGAAK